MTISENKVVDKISKTYVNSRNTVVVSGIEMKLDTSMAVYGNGGCTLLPSASRASRFYGYVYKDISLEVECNAPNHHIYCIGDTYSCTIGFGKIMALAFKKNMKGLAYPARVMCKCAGVYCVIWVKIKKGRKHYMHKIKLFKLNLIYRFVNKFSF